MRARARTRPWTWAATRSLPGCTLALGVVALFMGPWCSPSLSVPLLARDEIMARAESALGASYSWARESWVPNMGGAGPDCSGYVLKCWEVPRSYLYEEEDPDNARVSPRYTTYDFKNDKGSWSSLPSRSYLKPGDILVRNNGSSGHVVIYGTGDRWGTPIVYEAPGTGLSVRRAARTLTSDYVPKRRDEVTEGTILLDNPTAKSTNGTGLSGTWTRSTSIPGYYQDDYQVHAASSTPAWARLTPRLPSTGYYGVSLRWTSSWNRASNARVTINTARGQVTRYVDQRANGGQWMDLGRYWFNEGYSTGSGSVAVHADGADGYVVIDGALFLP